MKKLSEYFHEHKKVLLIALLLVMLIVLAAILYGSKAGALTETSAAEQTETEAKLMNILSEIDGVGKAQVMITESGDEISGVIIVCEGAQNIMTRNDVINAVTVAFDIDRTNIAIYAMK